MNLYEYEAYDKIFKKYAIPTPKYIFTRTIDRV
jgi:citryl-CoA synthetase large subunit